MKITDFLKKYSLIDSKFIDEFYGFYDNGNNEYDFVIDFDNIVEWLTVRKDHLKRLLEDNFIKNQDYMCYKNESNKVGRSIIKIKLTYTASKLLCMLSRSEKANIIRNHYIELEKLLIKYKDEIVIGLNYKLGIKINNKDII